jgi:hypothetical protein
MIAKSHAAALITELPQEARGLREPRSLTKP